MLYLLVIVSFAFYFIILLNIYALLHEKKFFIEYLYKGKSNYVNIEFCYFFNRKKMII